MNSKQKILFLHHGTGIGGAPISMLETIKSLNRNLFDVEVLLIKDSVVREMLEKEGIKVSVANSLFYKKIYQFFPHLEPHYFKFWEIWKISTHAIYWLMSKYYFSHQLLKQYKFNVLHLNSSVLTDFLFSGQKQGKTIIHIREPVAKGYFGIRVKIIKNEIKNYASKVISISTDNAKRLNLPEKTTVVYNFTEINSSPNFDIENKKYVLYLGGDSLIKGFLTMVDSLDYLDDDVKILFCGHYQNNRNSHSILDSIKSAIHQIRPSNQLISKARAKMRSSPKAIELGLRSDVKELLGKSCVLVSPFSVEHFSRPIIEAFANGRCAIGTDVEGMEELIKHDINGLIVPKNDAKLLASAINNICSNNELRIKLSKAGYEFSKKNFSRENIKEIQKIYIKLLSISEEICL